MNIGDIQKKQKPILKPADELPTTSVDMSLLTNPMYNMQYNWLASFAQMAAMSGFGAPNASFAAGLPWSMGLPNTFSQPKSSSGMSNKKVINQPMLSLDNYDDIHAIRDHFECLREVNDSKFRVDSIKDAEFYIIRSSNDDDIHKVGGY